MELAEGGGGVGGGGARREQVRLAPRPRYPTTRHTAPRRNRQPNPWPPPLKIFSGRALSRVARRAGDRPSASPRCARARSLPPPPRPPPRRRRRHPPAR